MLKKLIAGAAGAGLVLTMAGAALAWDGTFVLNKAKVKNFTLTVANSGMNTISADDDVKGGKIKTGDAFAYGEVNNVVNTTSVEGCGCDDTTVINKAKVKNTTLTFANTGMNSISAGDDVRYGGRIRTGGAEAGSVVTNVVNTTMVGTTESEPES